MKAYLLTGNLKVEILNDYTVRKIRPLGGTGGGGQNITSTFGTINIMSTIRFEAKLIKIGALTILTLPKNASAKLPSRGMVMVEGKVNDSRFQAPLEPDGKGGHWLKVEKAMREVAKTDQGDTVMIEMSPIKEWPEPKVPTDLKKALTDVPNAHATWRDITPMARWEWIRWIGSTKNLETRKKRIGVALSKMNAGNRRPCCFNRSACTDPAVSNNGVLLEPTQILKS